MATANEEWFIDGYTPKEALVEELSYWGDDEGERV